MAARANRQIPFGDGGTLSKYATNKRRVSKCQCRLVFNSPPPPPPPPPRQGGVGAEAGGKHCVCRHGSAQMKGAFGKFVCLLVGCITSQQQARVSQGRICFDNFTCCHTEIEVSDQTFYLTQSQYTDTGPTSPSADPITPGAWQGSHWSADF